MFNTAQAPEPTVAKLGSPGSPVLLPNHAWKYVALDDAAPAVAQDVSELYPSHSHILNCMAAPGRKCTAGLQE